ncbi:TIGR03085 family protein [Frankia sp. EI5c]|uniref:TIGR03085 family metal-binding protein n=1 Tax=Frankia sp. EI5c TaxID=683316 RepID=UPI0007C38358|nr:TIGR03085 family metal-binding protein [Frankia sp. EI5c]OAA25638.1 TIGR03085 family protein [Frankia sp. EI5c]
MAAGRARVRREILADLLRELGPASPTLCAGWTAHDLAAHLVTRERAPWAGPGLVVGALHGVTERAERATMRAHRYPELVEMFRCGPPWWHPARLTPVDDAANLVEFYVHTEDLRRAAPGYTPADPFGGAGGGRVGGGLASNPPADDAAVDRDAMWAALRLIGLAGFRHSEVGVVVERTDAPGRLALRRREPVVEIVGPPEELLLFAFGRRAAAQVELRGDPEAVAHLAGPLPALALAGRV